MAALEQTIAVTNGVRDLPASSVEARFHCEAVAPELLQESVEGQWRCSRTGKYQREKLDPKTGDVADEFHGTRRVVVDAQGWREYVDQRVAALASVELELARLRDERDAEFAAAERLRDFYIEKC
jgi:hypothetical protein